MFWMAPSEHPLTAGTPCRGAVGDRSMRNCSEPLQRSWWRAWPAAPGPGPQEGLWEHDSHQHQQSSIGWPWWWWTAQFAAIYGATKQSSQTLADVSRVSSSLPFWNILLGRIQIHQPRQYVHLSGTVTRHNHSLSPPAFTLLTALPRSPLHRWSSAVLRTL